MKPKSLTLLLIVISSSLFAQLSSQKTAITDVDIIDVREGRLLENMTVLIEGGRIARVGTTRKVKVPSGYTVVDGAGRFIMPGMTDGHIHFFQSGGLYTRPDAINLTTLVPYRSEIRSGKAAIPDYFSRYLRLGITTVADVGGPMRNFIIRDSLAGKVPSPDVLVTGPLFSMVRNEELEIDGDIPIVRTTTIEEADSLFSVMLPRKPDYIKIWYIVTPDLPAEKTFPVVKHIAERTHQAGLKLAVHATQLKTAELAVEAGADILVHSIDNATIPSTFVKSMRDKKVTYIPTLIVMGNYHKTFSGERSFHPQDLAYANPFFYGSLTDLETISPELLPPHVRAMRKNGISPMVKKFDSIRSANLKALADANINIVAGTDAGNIGTQHASSFLQELAAMENAGLTKAQVLRSATLNPALAFGRNSGVVEQGKEADLLLLRNNPLIDLENLNSIEAVISDGNILKADSLIVDSPVMIVQRQLNAYNARDLDAFLDTYSDEIELFTFPDKLMSKGKDAMRVQYGEMFTKLKYLHCTIEERIVLKNRVIDHERVRFNDQTVHAVAIYEIENGKIRKVTFMQ